MGRVLRAPPVRVLATAGDVRRLARDHPEDLVFVHDRSGYRLAPAWRLDQEDARG